MGALAFALPPLPPPPSPLKRSATSSLRRRCRFCSRLSRSDSVSSAPTTYRPAVILPGLGNNTNDYDKLALILRDYGVPCVVARVSRIDWLRNAAGLLDSNYWRGTLRPRPVLDWYLERVGEAVMEAKELAQGSTLSLIGHSAGGWLARVYLQEFGISDVSLLLTLGTPHIAPPKGVSGVIDQTRGLLDFVEKHCPKAIYTRDLRYVCIAGRYIQGARLVGSNNRKSSSTVVQIEQQGSEMGTVETSTPASATLRARFVGQGYKQVCGQADVWGDGVVPEMSAHLEGALNMSVDGVYHSPVGSDDEMRPWYGSPAIVEQWIHHLFT
ncbi:alpha/beta-Hydrolases superfamily protein [Striga hermonthica]|uniref:GPI inositol-deacylase n=1 Tax=Striga hermonthica TaxID=68872 RepID=A0A9N7N5G2_STRHE|nr:alpha/beta-Hydrolases superfamily protein [Striga hermonthica]